MDAFVSSLSSSSWFLIDSASNSTAKRSASSCWALASASACAISVASFSASAFSRATFSAAAFSASACCFCFCRISNNFCECLSLTLLNMEPDSASIRANRSSGVMLANRSFSAFLRSCSSKNPRSLSRPKAIFKLKTACICLAMGSSSFTLPS